MKEIKFENLKEHLTHLKKGKKICFRIDEKDSESILNKLLYLMIGIQSLENLFKTCLLEKNDVLNEININKVLEKYTKSQFEFEKIKKDFILKILGEENYILLGKQGLSWLFDPTTNLLIINKIYHKNE